MKRFASGLLALAIAVMPAAVFAEGNDTNTTTPGSTTEQPATTTPENGQTTTPEQNQNNGQTPEQSTTTPGSGEQNGGQTQTPGQGNTTQPGGNEQNGGQNSGTSEQKEEVEIVVDPALIPSEDEEGVYNLGLIAELKDVKNAEGTWTVEAGGKKHEFKGAKIDEEIIPLGKGDHFTVNIEFTGTADGKQVSGKKTLEIHVPGFKVNYKVVNGKHELSGMIEGAKEVEGNWYVGVGDPDSWEAVDEKIVEGSKELSFSHQFELKPGLYVGLVMFEGYVDGVYMGLYDFVEFEVTEDGKGDVTKPSDDDKSPVVNPDKGKKAIDDAKKGGQLPKTATAYPTGAAAGLALLAGGLAMLKLRRTA